MLSTLKQLKTAIAENPQDRDTGHLLGEVFHYVQGALSHPDKADLEQSITAIEELASSVRSMLGRDDDRWKLWYGGQLEAVVGLFRVALHQQPPSSALRVVRSRQHALSILKALAQEDLTIGQLQTITHINDGSQMSREVERLEQVRIVQTIKEGRQRWVQLTPVGRNILEKLTEPGRANKTRRSRFGGNKPKDPTNKPKARRRKAVVDAVRDRPKVEMEHEYQEVGLN